MLIGSTCDVESRAKSERLVSAQSFFMLGVLAGSAVMLKKRVKELKKSFFPFNTPSRSLKNG